MAKTSGSSLNLNQRNGTLALTPKKMQTHKVDYLWPGCEDETGSS